MRKTLIYFLLVALVSVACSEKSNDPTPKITTRTTPDGMYFKGTLNGTDVLYQNGKDGAGYTNINLGINKTANYASNVKKQGNGYFQVQYGTVDYETDSLNFSSIFKVGKFAMGFKLGNPKPAYQFGYIAADGEVYTSLKYAIEITGVSDYSNKSINTPLGAVTYPVATQLEGLITSAYLVNKAGTDSVRVENVEFRTVMSQLYGTK